MEAVGQSVKIGQHKIKVVKNNGKKWENSGKTVEKQWKHPEVIV